MLEEEINKYLNKIDEPKQKLVLYLIKQIRQLVPDSILYISYGMPCFKYKGKYLIGVGAFKHHVSIFPGSEVIVLLKDELKDYKISKGTIQLNDSKDIPKQLISKIVQIRIKAINK